MLEHVTRRSLLAETAVGVVDGGPRAQGAEPLITSPETFLKMLEADVMKWAKVVKSAGVTLN